MAISEWFGGSSMTQHMYSGDMGDIRACSAHNLAYNVPYGFMGSKCIETYVVKYAIYICLIEER